jgi:hypothetical protein
LKTEPFVFSFYYLCLPTVKIMIRKLGKFFKKIAVLFLWLAVIIIMAHAVVPHDHHSEFSGSFPDTSCNAHENGVGNNRPLPLHCHAFNDLVCEKFTFFFYKLQKTSYSYLPVSAHLVSASIAPAGRLVLFQYRHFTLATSELSPSDPFRAPPFFI